MRSLRSNDPHKVGPYEIIGLLGEGGMGTVYLGRKDGALAAVKVMRRLPAMDIILRRRFRDEIKNTQKVSSQFTAKILDFGVDDELRWYASEYIPGPTLAEAIRMGPLTTAALKKLAYSLGRALQDIHRAGVIHRDLKPSNIIMGSNGLRVVDFGIAHAVGDARLTEHSNGIGTPEYLAPERFDFGSSVLPAPTALWDIFAYGVILLQAATGRSPFDGVDQRAILHAVLHRNPDIQAVPQSLRAVVEGCLAKDPTKRMSLDRVMTLVPKPTAAEVQTSSWMPDKVAMEARRATLLATRLAQGTAVLPDTKVASSVSDRARPVSGGSAGVGRSAVAKPQVKPSVSPPAKKPGDRGMPLAAWILCVLLVGSVLGLGLSGAFDGEQKPQDSTAPEISLPVALFEPASLSGGGATPTKVETDGRSIRLTFDKTQGAQVLIDNACLRINRSAEKHVQIAATKSVSDASNGVVNFGNGLNYPGKIYYFADCKKDANPEDGLLLGENDVSSWGALGIDTRLLPIVNVVTDDRGLSVILERYNGMTEADYAIMCLKIDGKGAKKPVVSLAQSGDWNYMVLTFADTAKGTLYPSCDTFGNPTGEGVAVP